MSDFTVRNYSVASIAPSAPASGDMWYNTTTGSLLAYNGVGWVGAIQQVVSDVQNQVAAATYAVSHPIFVAPNTGETWKVVAASAVFGTTSTSGTLQVEVATGTQAVGSGTNQLTGTVSLSGTANTTVNGTVSATPTTIAAGSRVNLIFAGTVTGLLNAVVSVTLAKLA